MTDASRPAERAYRHLILRPRDGKPLFRDDADRRTLLDGLAGLDGVGCLAWVLLPAYVELILGGVPDALRSQRLSLESGYARAFNARHQRRGFLFTGPPPREIRADELERVALDLHLTPLLAGEVRDLDSLERFPWSSLSAWMGHRARLTFESGIQSPMVIAADPDHVRAELERRIAGRADPRPGSVPRRPSPPAT